ncbi:hypothetical protein F4695_003428 [Rhizobium soli]|uniref:Uncharacterized protein n=1 Tax=Rhizobium soli TaxID=424798 RepID=A0A7X0JLY7_9HYPH|nr:hypothetical protein [Rhizobium soli]
MIGARCLGAAEMDRKRGEGRAIGNVDRWLDGQLFDAHRGNLAAAPTARGESDHQDCSITDVAQALGVAGCQHLAKDIAGNSLVALSPTWSGRRPHSEPYC